ncbi:MAG: phosphate acyltransferase PlsX [Anaerolineae bacterium]
MKIALDAMGGDNAPVVTVQGAVWAARDFNIEIQLVGKPEVIQAELARYDASSLPLQVIPASEVIEMVDQPAAAVKAKKDASMTVALRSLKEGRCDACVTAGNSGGALASALFTLKRIPGIKRPALSTVYPTASEYGRCFLLDVGANADVKPEYLLQFGLMGSHYAERVLSIPTPRVGLVSNGEEDGKGSILVQETARLMKASDLNFIGNVEGKDIPAGLADVVVTDGFTGNVLLKASEGVGRFLMETFKQEVRARPVAAVVSAVLLRGAFKALEKKIDYREFGGGALLGVNGVVVVAHGRSDAYAIRNALHLAKQSVEQDIIGAIKSGLNA